ncbi:Uncharacterised protein [Vibrio cholerae]|nr:Uncharacterised protein [Vibrio cholerae]
MNRFYKQRLFGCILRISLRLSLSEHDLCVRIIHITVVLSKATLYDRLQKIGFYKITCGHIRNLQAIQSVRCSIQSISGRQQIAKGLLRKARIECSFKGLAQLNPAICTTGICRA